MSYTHVANGSFSSLTGMTVSPGALGNAIVLSIRCNDTAALATTISGGGCASWSKVYEKTTLRPSTALKYVVFFIGKVTSTTASQALTISGNSNFNAANIEIVVDEYSSSLGASAIWAVDGPGNETEGAVGTMTYPTKTPTHDGIYHGYGIPTGTPGSGGTTGFTYITTVAHGNQIAYDLTATVAGGALTPTGTDSSSDWAALALLIFAGTAPSQSRLGAQAAIRRASTF